GMVAVGSDVPLGCCVTPGGRCGDGPCVGVGTGMGSLSPMWMRQLFTSRLLSARNTDSPTPNFDAIPPHVSPDCTSYSVGVAGVSVAGGGTDVGGSVVLVGRACVAWDVGVQVGATVGALVEVVAAVPVASGSAAPPALRSNRTAPNASATITAATPITPQ